MKRIDRTHAFDMSPEEEARDAEYQAMMAAIKPCTAEETAAWLAIGNNAVEVQGNHIIKGAQT